MAARYLPIDLRGFSANRGFGKLLFEDVGDMNCGQRTEGTQGRPTWCMMEGHRFLDDPSGTPKAPEDTPLRQRAWRQTLPVPPRGGARAVPMPAQRPVQIVWAGCWPDQLAGIVQHARSVSRLGLRRIAPLQQHDLPRKGPRLERVSTAGPLRSSSAVTCQNTRKCAP